MYVTSLISQKKLYTLRQILFEAFTVLQLKDGGIEFKII